MTREEVRSRIAAARIVPVIRAASAKQAMEAAEALSAAGIAIVEVTMTVPDALELINRLRCSTQLLVGAGTVLNAGTARECVEAGAEFLVSPICDPETVSYSRDCGLLSMAGALTPNEVFAAWKSGADIVKIFPCSSAGGAPHLRALRTVFPQIEMIPTGGVNLANAAEFIRAGAIAVGIGSELVSGEPAAIAGKARQLVASMTELSR